ncbi:type IX secretion system outer membrane channel protein PorV [Mucilaginibacter sp. JRF]|uniref:type IX secretion system outer membrane channel protein PorV n=1 Tax=Mucilaginibacter sp. JRF TaxID=2780088 RepID=UPI00187E82AB|nr:type IX secretion system outer membrane channel protein PorV [Mucilaginibacter sp. JRF]MBE9583257.1 type IX secretion system outer membrane channel protein PorV [Mucilaginibacter sp. JRF]
MKRYFLRLICTILLMGISGKLFAQSNSSSGVPFLNIVPDSRSAAMGDVGAATSADADPNAMYHNASKLAFATDTTAFSLSYTPWFRNLGVKDAYMAFLSGYSVLDERQTIAASLKYFSLGDVDFTNDYGDLLQQYRANELAIDVAYIRKMSNNFSMSLSAIYIRSAMGSGSYNNLDLKPGNAVAATVGLYLKDDVKLFNKETKLALGVNLGNLGTKIGYGNQRAFLPANLKVGGTAQFKMADKNMLAWSLDFNKLLIPDNADEDMSLPNAIGKSFSPLSLSVGTGLEYWYDQVFAVRAGYFAGPSKYNVQYLTAGTGFKYHALQFDLSYLISTKSRSAIDNTLRLSLIYAFK